MGSLSLKVKDVIPKRYSDFVDYCQNAGIICISEISPVDYVAFRTISGQSRLYINEIKSIVENPSLKQIAENPSDANDVESITAEVPMLEKGQTASEVNNSEIGLESKTEGNLKYLETPVVPEIIDIEETFQSNKTIRPKKHKTYEKSMEDSSITLSELLNVDPSKCSNIAIEELQLSARASNCMRRVSIITLKDLLGLTKEHLQSIRNMGKKTADEIIQKLSDYFVSDAFNDDDDSFSIEAFDCKNTIYLDFNFKTAIESLLAGQDFSTGELTAQQMQQLSCVKDAMDTCGEDICLQAYLDPKYVSDICGSLLSFSASYLRKYKLVDSLASKMSTIPESLKNSKILPFLNCFCSKDEEQFSQLSVLFNDESTVRTIPAALETADERILDTVIKEISKFVEWLETDFYQLIESTKNTILDSLSNKNERGVEVFLLRAKGKTLEEVGAMFGVTRERIRQMEAKTIRKFWGIYNHQKIDLILLIYALRNGENYLSFVTCKEVLGEDFAFLLWGIERTNQSHETHFYSKLLDAIIVRDGTVSFKNDHELEQEVNSIFATMPKTISELAANRMLGKAAVDHHLPSDVLVKMFENAYTKTGAFYSQERITVVFMCDYVLKARFPAGFKIADEFEAERFKQYMIEFFGEKAQSITFRAIDAKVGEIGILCDRGKYIHPDYLQVDQSVIDALNDYIDQSPRTILPYGEIFEAMKDLLSGTLITNRFLLQGALKKYGCRFPTGRDFVRKNDSISFVDELEAFMEERGVVHKSEIFAEFTSLSEAGLGQVVARSNDVFSIDDGNYIHASQFDIQPEDYEPLREYLAEACKEVPVNIRAVQESVAALVPSFMYRNDFENRNKLFAALQYMFRDEFVFSRPYIAKLGAGEITNRSVILQHIKDYDTIEIDDLIDICNENQIRYIAASNMCQSLAPVFFRISDSTIMRREFTGISDEVIDEAVKMVAEMLETNDYVVGARVDDFLWFPQIGVDWNEFLLESLIAYSKKINIVWLTGDSLKHPNAIYVSDRFKNDSLESFLVKILSDEVKKGSFPSKQVMREWLLEKGLIEGKLPNFLTGNKYFYVNQTGVHCSEE